MITFLLRGPRSGEYVTTEDCKIVILTMFRNPSGITKIVSEIKMFMLFVRARKEILRQVALLNSANIHFQSNFNPLIQRILLLSIPGVLNKIVTIFQLFTMLKLFKYKRGILFLSYIIKLYSSEYLRPKTLYCSKMRSKSSRTFIFSIRMFSCKMGVKLYDFLTDYLQIMRKPFIRGITLRECWHYIRRCLCNSL